MFDKIRDRFNDLMNSTVALATGASAGWLLHKHLTRLDQNQMRKMAEKLGPAAADFMKLLLKGSPSADCKDCSRYAYGFMLKDDVWLEALTQGEKDEYPETTTIIDRTKPPLYVCLHCIEKRLDRKLTVDDFNKNTPLNRTVLYAYGTDVIEHSEEKDQPE